MKAVFPNSATLAVRERLVLRGGGRRRLALKVRYCVVIHPEAGPILIDTGYTGEAVDAPRRSAMLRLYGAVLRPQVHTDAQPRAVLAAHGFAPTDVRHVVVTHFHADHIAGLAQFPNAIFHVDGAAWAAVNARGQMANLRHGVFAELLPADFDTRVVPFESRALSHPEGLPAGRDLFGDGRIVVVPLPGHAEGHVGVHLTTETGPVFYAVDVQWLLQAVRTRRPPGFPARLVAEDPESWLATTRTLEQVLARETPVVLCHDPEPSAFDWTPE